MKQAANQFALSVDRDTDPSRFEPSRLRNLVNFRFTSVEGKGLICANVQGNELSFQLTDGFIPLGAAEYKGVVFITSHNPTTGEGEIGCYPAPALAGTGGYDHVYRPLQNWTGAVDPASVPNPTRLPLRTTLFNFSEQRQHSMEIALDYDGSVNLYFADWRNPLRVINCGFEVETGAYNTRYLWNGNFNLTNAFFETCPHPVVDGVILEEAGIWPGGNTIFYIRYRTETLDRTSFLGESGPIQVSRDLPSTGIQTDGTLAEVSTGKAVRLNLINIDPSFPVIEVAFAYYSDDTVEYGLIDQVYPTTPGSSTMSILITGLEDVVDITPDEIISRKSLADAPRSLTQFQSVLWAVNPRERTNRDDIMLAVAQDIIARPPAAAALDFHDDGFFRLTPGVALGYKDYVRTFEQVGYFRMEPYAFGIVFVFKDGKESQPYPVTGYDAWLDPGALATNPNGVLRFPSNMSFDGPDSYAMYQDRGFGWKVWPMGVTFDTTGVTLPTWITDNVCGFYFVRGERKKQLVYQGNVTNCWRPETPFSGSDWETIALGPLGSIDGQTFTSNWIPEFSQGYANPDIWNIATREKEGCASGDIHFRERLVRGRVPGKFGLFSTDHFFEGSVTNGQYWVVIQGLVRLPRYGMSSAYGGSSANSRLPDELWEQDQFTPGSDVLTSAGASPNYGKALVYNVAENEYSATGGGFVSKFAEAGQAAEAQGAPSFFYAWNDVLGCRREFGNREIKQRRYVGLVVDGPSETNNLENTLRPLADECVLVNVYRTDPTLLDIASLYNPRTTQYYRISDFIDITNLPSMTGIRFYRGDCFVQRTYHRQTSSFANGTDGLAENGKFYRYGNMVGAVQEMVSNSAMRSVTTEGSYYPETGWADPGHFAFDYNSQPESKGMNRGYNRTLGAYSRLGFDTELPALRQRYPTRMIYSNRKVTGAIDDAYRRWDLAAFKDFDARKGEMVHVGVEGSALFTVQEFGMNVHSVRERGIVGDGQGGALVIGEGEVLSDRFGDIGPMSLGSQHQFSIVKGTNGTYGYDWRNRVMWRYRGGQQLEPISLTKAFRSDLQEISTALSDHSDITHVPADAPVAIAGVSGWSDRLHGEVGMTFRFAGGSAARSIVFSELTDTYSGSRTHHSPFYLNIGNDLFSADPSRMPWSVPAPATVRGVFWRHNSQAVPYTSFYGTAPFSVLEFIANPERGLTKVFDAVHVMSNPVAPARYTASTLLQSYTLNPFLVPDLWARPVYKEDNWRMPVLRATTVAPGQDYLIGTAMRGNWLSVELQWESGAFVEASGSISTFRTSKT